MGHHGGSQNYALDRELDPERVRGQLGAAPPGGGLLLVCGGKNEWYDVPGRHKFACKWTFCPLHGRSSPNLATNICGQVAPPQRAHRVKEDSVAVLDLAGKGRKDVRNQIYKVDS